MQIDKNSWHYKLVREQSKFFSVSLPTSLCPYMRRLFLWLPLTLAGGLAVVSAAIWLLIGAPLIVLISMIFEGVPLDVNHITGGLGFIGIVLWCFSLIVMLCIFLSDVWKYGYGNIDINQLTPRERFQRASRNASERISEKVSSSSTLGLLSNYWNALHDKVCPTLEFTDGSKQVSK